MLLSQERVAQMSGLSLRTVQRLEAGHRVSYASLRALAATFEIDVDQLEREFYAVNKPTDEFIEIPRWVRLFGDRRWFGGRGLSRRDVLIVEAFSAICGIGTFAGSFLIGEAAKASAFRVIAIAPLVGCYLTALSIRTMDKYKLWPGAENAPPERPRTWRTIAAEYTYFLAVGILGTALLMWLFVGSIPERP